MAHSTHKSLKPVPTLPHVYIGTPRTKLYLPRGSRTCDQRGWSDTYAGPILYDWQNKAQEKGFDLVKRIRDKAHVALLCHRCGALTAHKIYTLRTAQPACAACRHLAVEATAHRARLTFQGYDPEDHKLGRYLAPCGHPVTRQFGQVERIANGRCKLRCETCHARKEADEAMTRGWRLLDRDPEGNPNYRLYQHRCGHKQRIARTNMQSGRFQCSNCGEGWASAKSAIYAIRLELPSRLRVVKLGFSRDPISRLRHQLLRKPGIEAELLRSVPQPSGHAANCREKALHRALKASHPDSIIPPERFRDWLSVKSEVYGIEIEPIILAHLDAIQVE